MTNCLIASGYTGSFPIGIVIYGAIPMMNRGHFYTKGLENNTIDQSQTPASLKNDDSRQKLYRQVLTASFVIQAVFIGVVGNIRVLTGDPLLDVIPSMLVQGVNLIMKAAKDSESKSRSSN